MIVVDDFPQLSDEWFAARLGNPGASNFDRILTNARGTESKQATDYMYELAAETLSGLSQESHTNEWMQRGNDLEQEARDYFQFHMDLGVRQVALCYPDAQKRYHCSPDGLLEDAGLEIKCPKPKTHIKYLIENKFPASGYNAQIQGSLLVSGFSHWWFMSYCPGIKPFIIKVLPDQEYQTKLRVALSSFCNSLARTIKKVR